MDLIGMIRSLYADKERLDRVIAALEELQHDSQRLPYGFPGNRRGRKSMGADERQEVSVRMKKYWANRRKAERG
jgi:hypothetical protein